MTAVQQKAAEDLVRDIYYGPSMSRWLLAELAELIAFSPSRSYFYTSTPFYGLASSRTISLLQSRILSWCGHWKACWSIVWPAPDILPNRFHPLHRLQNQLQIQASL